MFMLGIENFLCSHTEFIKLGKIILILKSNQNKLFTKLLTPNMILIKF
jgi:hypothetical protein